MMLTVSLNCLGAALFAAGEFEEARHTLREAVQLEWQYDYMQMLMTAFYYFAALLAVESNARCQQLRAVASLGRDSAQLCAGLYGDVADLPG